MREGDKWQIVVPAELAYGRRSMGEHIQSGSVLVFEMELVQVENEGPGRGIWGTLLGLVPRCAPRSVRCIDCELRDCKLTPSSRFPGPLSCPDSSGTCRTRYGSC